MSEPLCCVCEAPNIAYLEKSVDFLKFHQQAIVAACSKNYRHNYKLESKLMRIGKIEGMKPFYA